MVFCKRLQKEMPGLTEAPLKGPLGVVILENVSAEAFNEWLELEIKILNEERLDLSEENAQRRLCEQMLAYLNLGDLVEI